METFRGFAMLMYVFSESCLGWVQVTAQALKIGPLCDYPTLSRLTNHLRIVNDREKPD